jgi:hypothetical protein
MKNPPISDEVIRAFAPQLGSVIRVETDHAGRPAQRKRIAALANAAQLIQRETADGMILSHILNGDLHWTENEHATMRGVEDIEARAHAALKKVPKGQGRHTHYPRPEGLPSTTLCALIVSATSQRWPGKDNKEAQSACEALWCAAGVPRHQSLAVWRDHLGAARAYRDKPEAQTIRNDMPPRGRKAPNISI